MYDGILAGFYVCECVDVSLYVYFYLDAYEFEGRDVVFCVVCSGVVIQDKSKTQLFHIIELYGVVWYISRNARYFLIYLIHVYVGIGM